jgi:hypothetical protein
MPHVSDFKMYHQELRMTKPGCYAHDQKPKILESLAAKAEII